MWLEQRLNGLYLVQIVRLSLNQMKRVSLWLARKLEASKWEKLIISIYSQMQLVITSNLNPSDSIFNSGFFLFFLLIIRSATMSKP